MRLLALALAVASVSCGTAGGAGANVAVGSALYVFAGGCKISGCPTNTKCNVQTERCDPIACDNKCKISETCDEARGVCVPSESNTASMSSSTVTGPAVPTPFTSAPGQP